LAQLPTLELLVLTSNQITDISPLNTLVNLTYLDFPRNGVQDVAPLSALVKLRHFNALENAITTGVATLVTLVEAATINLDGNNLIPCADLNALEAALGAGVVTRPVACVGQPFF
jgi:Leucine-rich repeat (LRR) protein